MENLWMCINNLPCILPIWRSWKEGDLLTCGSIMFGSSMSSMSAISHLIENHKHGMPGFLALSKDISYLFNRFDVLGSIMVISRFGYLYYHKYKFTYCDNLTYIFIMAILSMISLRISEYDNKNVRLKSRYLFFHSIWHITIYPIMYLYLDRIIY